MTPDLGSPTTLVLVRHGSTDETDHKRASGGDGEGPPLNDHGRQQVGRLTRALADLAEAQRGYEAPADSPPWVEMLGTAPVAAVVASPQRRAWETAAHLAGPLRLTPTASDDWREIRLGEWDGLTYGELAARWPDEFQAWRSSPSIAPPGGESLHALAVRVRDGRRTLVQRYPGRIVLVVTHTAPIRAVVADALEAGPVAFWRLRVDPGAVSVVRFWADGGCEVSAVNSTGHLA